MIYRPFLKLMKVEILKFLAGGANTYPEDNIQR